MDAAQKAYKGRGLQVVALSLDGKNMVKVQKFFAENKIASLAPLFDANMKIFHMLKLRGLPTTIFANAKGEEIARAEGALDWHSEAVKKIIAENDGFALR